MIVEGIAKRVYITNHFPVMYTLMHYNVIPHQLQIRLHNTDKTNE